MSKKFSLIIFTDLDGSLLHRDNFKFDQIKDFIKSDFQKFVHKHWIKLHVVIVAVLALIDLRLVCFMISPFVVYTFHTASLVNTLSHKDGEPRNATELKFISWWGWNHGDHHDYVGK